MPELPEVEVLARHLDPALRGRIIRSIRVYRDKIIAPDSPARFRRTLTGCRFVAVQRRAKYLIFTLEPVSGGRLLSLIGHLGMTGRMYLLPGQSRRPKHTAVALHLGAHTLVLEDTRYFGRLILAPTALPDLGPEPLSSQFDRHHLARTLGASRQPLKVRLLDQRVVAGLGNIYASEALFRSRLAPGRPAHSLSPVELAALCRAIRHVLRHAIRWGSTVPLNWAGHGPRDRLFYYGRTPGAPDLYEERLAVYDRAGQPCPRCRTPIARIAQAGRSTYFCPCCQA